MEVPFIQQQICIRRQRVADVRIVTLRTSHRAPLSFTMPFITRLLAMQLRTLPPVPQVDLKGHTYIITGANSGEYRRSCCD